MLRNCLTLLCFSLLSTYTLAREGGWNLLKPSWQAEHPLDFLSIEWEYFMIHDDQGRFNGIIGVVLTNPRGKGGVLGQVIPEGGNLAVGGQFNGAQAIAEFRNFGRQDTEIFPGSKDVLLRDDQGYWARLDESPEGDLIQLTGSSETFEWDFLVSEDDPEIMQDNLPGNAFSAVTDTRRAGRIPGEQWTVDALWPKTRVNGWIKNRNTGELVHVNGKGYRENSWGRYLMPLDGWDFLVFSEHASDGVNFVVQTYHHSHDLDFIDLAFRDDGELRKIRFGRDSFHWRHDQWRWNKDAFQCVPQDWQIVAEADGYRLQASVSIDEAAQAPFLSDIKLGTKIFFIQEQYPTVSGEIRRLDDGSLVTRFAGQAGGEFALHKRSFPVNDATCKRWGQRRFSN